MPARHFAAIITTVLASGIGLPALGQVILIEEEEPKQEAPEENPPAEPPASDQAPAPQEPGQEPKEPPPADEEPPPPIIIVEEPTPPPQQPPPQQPPPQQPPPQQPPPQQPPPQQPPPQQPLPQQPPPQQPLPPQGQPTIPPGQPAPQPGIQPEVTPPGPQEEEDSLFKFLTLAPEVGYARYREAEIELYGYPLKIQARNAVVAKVHFDLGGDGVGLEIVPFLSVETGGDTSPLADLNMQQGLEGGLGGNYVAFGLEGAIVYRFTLATFFPHLGLGIHGGYLSGTEIKYGAELYGRIPVGFTWYFSKYLGLSFEFNLMYGATGLRTTSEFSLEELREEYQEKYEDELDFDNFDPYDPSTYPEDMEQEDFDAMVEAEMAKQFQFGQGLAFDLMIGLRFP